MMHVVWDPQLGREIYASAFISLSKPRQVFLAAGWSMLEYEEPAGGTPKSVVLSKSGRVSLSQLARSHDCRYVSGVAHQEIPNGFGNTDFDTLQHVLCANGVMIRAVQLALDNPANVVCAPVSGFHHAHYGEPGGYCTFNGLLVAIAAERASGRGRLNKVLIIDGDAHHGDGTDDIILRQGLAGITNLTHKSKGPNSLSPNIWEMQIRGLLTNQEWDLVIYQAGADAHKNDPYGAGYLNDAGWDFRDMLIFQTCRRNKIPLVFNLAGGYNGEETVKLHLRTISSARAIYASAPFDDALA